MIEVREIVIEVPDVEDAAAFYTGLGMREHGRGTWEGGPYVALADDLGGRVMLVEGDGGVRLTLNVDDAHGSLADAERRGARRESEPAPGGGGTWAPSRDPWGNRIGFWSPA